MTVVSFVQITGVYLVFSYLIVPAVCGALLSADIRTRLIIGWTVALIAGVSGLMLSVAMLLDWLGARHNKPAYGEASRAIEAALDSALADAQARTPDLGGKGTTTSFAKAVIARVEAGELLATGTR